MKLRQRTTLGLTFLAATAAFAPFGAHAVADTARAAVPAASASNTAPAPAPAPLVQLPGPTTLKYAIKKGGWSGNGELIWEPAGTRYNASLEGRVAGFTVMSWNSAGALGAQGIAPNRFTDLRRGRKLRSAEFEPKRGKVSYGGTAPEQDWHPGIQDRLSWMVQIGGLATADPSRLARGAKLSLWVTGARGDSDEWTFQSQGVDAVQTRSGVVNAVKLLREPRKPNDTKVEVWLDPRQHHLPVRARLSSHDGDVLELLQRNADPS